MRISGKTANESWRRNAHNAHCAHGQVRLVRASYVVCIGVTQRLIDGHGRQKIVDPKTPVPVLIGSWSEAAEKRILLTLDPIAGMAIADIAQLEALLDDVKIEDEWFAGLCDQLDSILEDSQRALNAQDQATDIIEDEVPLPPDRATTKPGDLWILGNHRLLCGDSSNPADVDRLLDGAPIHLINTDPPYGVKVEPRSNNAIAAGLSSFRATDAARRSGGMTHHQGFDLERHPEKAKATTRKLRAKDRPLANDFVSEKEFARLLAAWFGNMACVLLPGSACAFALASNVGRCRGGRVGIGSPHASTIIGRLRKVGPRSVVSTINWRRSRSSSSGVID